MSLIVTTRTTFAFVCLFACISHGPSMRAWQVSKLKRKWGKALMRIRAKHFLSPLAPDTQVMMAVKERLHEMDYRGTLCHREVSLFRLEVHKRNVL